MILIVSKRTQRLKRNGVHSYSSFLRITCDSIYNITLEPSKHSVELMLHTGIAHAM